MESSGEVNCITVDVDQSPLREESTIAAADENWAGTSRDSETEWRSFIADSIEKLANKDLDVTSSVRTSPIFRVPERVRAVKPEHFEPNILRMGLLHRRRFEIAKTNHSPTQEPAEDSEKRSMIEKAEKFRLRSASQLFFMARLSTEVQHMLEGGQQQAIDWQSLCHEVVEDPADIQRSYYALLENFDYQEDTVRYALTLDTFFLLHFMLFGWEYEISGESRSFKDLLVFDLIKLENQIPLSLIRRTIQVLSPYLDVEKDGIENRLIHQMSETVLRRTGSCLPGFHRKSKFLRKNQNFEDCDHLLECICKVMNPRRPGWVKPSRSDPGATAGRDSRYLLQVFLLFQTMEAYADDAYSEGLPSVYSGRPRHIVVLPPAGRLADAGVRFQGIAFDDKWEGEDVDLIPKFRVGFLSVSLHIPSVFIQSFTERMWRNIVGHEMQGDAELDVPKTNFIYFLQFMDEMVHTEHDVRLLRHGINPVIKENSEGDDHDLVNLFRSILQNYKVSESKDPKWIALRRDIIKFYSNRPRRWVYEVVAKFREPYIDKPWLVVSLLAAIVLLVFTFLQTMYSILTFYENSNN